MHKGELPHSWQCPQVRAKTGANAIDGATDPDDSELGLCQTNKPNTTCHRASQTNHTFGDTSVWPRVVTDHAGASVKLLTAAGCQPVRVQTRHRSLPAVVHGSSNLSARVTADHSCMTSLALSPATGAVPTHSSHQTEACDALEPQAKQQHISQVGTVWPPVKH